MPIIENNNYIKAICDNCNKEYFTTKYVLKNKNVFCCKKCWDDFQIKQKSQTFIERAKKIHEDLYDYSKTKYIGALKKITIICKQHGEFQQIANNHLRSGCEKCSKLYIGVLKKQKTIENFLKLAPKIHNNFYDYSLINIHTYDTSTKNRIVKIICPVHGEFNQRIDAHLRGQKCKKCQRSKSIGEQTIQNFLDKNNINYNYHYRFNNLVNPKNNYALEFDFYCQEKNICIEFNGRQHYEPVNFDKTKNLNIEYIKLKTEKNFKQQQINDNLKKEYCKKNKIKLIIIPYWNIEKIEKILGKFFI